MAISINLSILCRRILCLGTGYLFFPFLLHSELPRAYDIDRAMEICDSIPLDRMEGIWIYPEDNVTVLVLKTLNLTSSALPQYSISVIESSDCDLIPGDRIGQINATPDSKIYDMELYSKRENNLLVKPRKCIATLSTEGETLLMKQPKSKFKIRININPSMLLPKLWRSLFRATTSSGNSETTSPIGMVKIYPSYDGNGSSKRAPRYL